MFLKSLDIHGFKSFANKTTLLFKPGVTAVVGPNGCGKSNIVDAIRWVLGESSARSLRAEVWGDVIFSGSEERKALGMAEVGITLVNDDGLLPVEYSEVNVTRRLYRSGESEFFLNKNSVRLKDIHELFADTGIGKESYSVMEQGNIDMILSNKPEDRMVIFEEAAGITRYKMRMKESYRKLASTEENLAKLAIILNEVEKEYKSLEKQAEKALIYKNLKKEEVEYETLYNHERTQLLRKQREKNDATVKDLKEKRSAQERIISELNERIRANIERVKGLEGEMSDIKSLILKKDAELEALGIKSSHYRDRIYELKDEVSKKRHLAEKIQKGKSELDARQERLREERKSIAELISSQDEKLGGYLRETELVSTAIAEDGEQVAANARALEELEGTVRGLTVALREVIDRLLKEIDGIKLNFKGNEEKKNQLVVKVNETISQIENTLKHHATRIGDMVLTDRVNPSEGAGAETLVRVLLEDVDRVKERLDGLQLDVQTVITIQDELSNAIFGKESLHSKKEQIEVTIEKHSLRIKELKDDNLVLNARIRDNRAKKEEFSSIVNNLRTDIARQRERSKYVEENLKRLVHELERNEESLQDVGFDIKSLGERIALIESELAQFTARNAEVESEKVALMEKTKTHNSEVDSIVDEIRSCESEVGKKKSQVDDLNEAIERYDLSNAETGSKISTIMEDFKERYSISLELFQPVQRLEMKIISEQRERIKGEIASLGQVNLLAIEEWGEVKKRYDYLKEQKEDLERAKEDINVAVEKTIKTTTDTFLQTLDTVNHNFNGIFRRLFNGGKTSLFLTNSANIFDSGVEIEACPPGKSLKKRSLLSGGEKGLTAISLLFAVFMVKPSPFCMLDEVDHDLDEENIVRFLKLLKEFADTTQFIIITHNRRTIEFADVIYGITAEEAGVSKVVSLDMKEARVE